MAKSLGLSGLLLVGTVSSAAAQSGFNLNWDNCSIGASVQAKTFACNTNAGLPFALVGSFVSPVPVDSMCGSEAVLDLISTVNPVLPAWWNFQTGGCRAGSLTAAFDFATIGPYDCYDPYGTNVGSSTLTYTPNDPGSPVNGPNTARIRIVASMPTTACATLDNASEYYGFKINIPRDKTVGAGYCAGCSDGMIIRLEEFKIVTPPRGTTDQFIRLLTPIANGCISWQAPVTWCFTGPCPPYCDPTRNETWGRIKALYR